MGVKLLKTSGIFFALFIALSASVAFAADGPRFSNEDIDNILQAQQENFAIVKKCDVDSFVPMDPDGSITKIEVLGLEDGYCKLRAHTSTERAEYLLPEEVYKNISDIEDLFKGECSGDCGNVEEASEAPEPADESEQCVRDCIVRNCSLSSLECERLNKDACDIECYGEAPSTEDMSEEELCILECVGDDIICSAGEGGEQNPECEECANKCSVLYEGPCLTDEQWKLKETACLARGTTWSADEVKGDSGEGYQCVVNLDCVDHSDEWGDDAGTGPASYEKGHEPSEDQVYWWDYEEEEEEVELEIEEEVEVDRIDDKLILKTDETEIIVEDRSEEIIAEYLDKNERVEKIELLMEDEKPIYKVKTIEQKKLLGLFSINMRIDKKIDAENLDLIKEEKPWWAFLTSEELKDLRPTFISHEPDQQKDEADDLAEPSGYGSDVYTGKATNEEALDTEPLDYETDCSPLPEIGTPENAVLQDTELGQHAYYNESDCEVIQRDSYKEKVIEQAEEYYNELSGVYLQMKNVLKETEAKAEDAKSKLDRCIGTSVGSSNNQPGETDINHISGILIKMRELAVQSSSPDIAQHSTYYSSDYVVSGNLNNMYHSISYAYIDLYKFDKINLTLNKYLDFVFEVCESGACLSPDMKEHIKEMIEEDLASLQEFVDNVYQDALDSLEAYGNLQSRVKELSEGESCSDYLNEYYYNSNGKRKEGGATEYNDQELLGDVTFDVGIEDSEDDSGVVRITSEDDSYLSKEDNRFIVEKEDKSHEFDEDVIAELIEEKGEDVRSVELGFEDDEPVLKINKIEKKNLLGFIPITLEETSIIDAETLEETDIDKPWWAFLASEEDENEEEASEEEEDEVAPGFSLGEEEEEDEGNNWFNSLLLLFSNEDEGDIICGDNFCHESEYESCPADCTTICGDGMCQTQLGESWNNCPQDCEPYEEEEINSVCGNGVCEMGENPDVCAQDCGACGDGLCGNHEVMAGDNYCPLDCIEPCGNQKCMGGETYLSCPVDCGICGDSFCGFMENAQNCPNDCKGTCGNTICEIMENLESCPVDCKPPCGNNVCDGSENPDNCWVDCGPSELTYKENNCGNGVCNGGENPENCATDCGWCGDGTCGFDELASLLCPSDHPICLKDFGTSPWCAVGIDCGSDCGNGICNVGENSKSCPFDCLVCGDGICALTETTESCENDCPDVLLSGCGDGECLGLEDSANCAADCASGCEDGTCSSKESILSCSADCNFSCGDGVCTVGEDCDQDCDFNCGDGVCYGAETVNSCPDDCSMYQQKEITYAADGEFCGDAECTQSENQTSCALDCEFTCGDGVCSIGESNASCNADCDPSCGNAQCEVGEGKDVCPKDCGWCGDGFCSENESLEICPQDCDACGNWICDYFEDETSCSVDCKVEPITTNPMCGFAECGDGQGFCVKSCGLCGDWVCAPSEKGVCDLDCSSACGNEICEADESTENCPSDCSS